MFTGLVEAHRPVIRCDRLGAGMRLEIDAGDLAQDAHLGDSICVSGCCLTVTSQRDSILGFDVGPETLRRTTLGDLNTNDRVNLERSLKFGDRLGGHLVTGHVDGLGRLARREDQHDWSSFWFDAPAELCRQMASKGSITIDGVSLTLVDVTATQFSVALIPHTLSVTTLGPLKPGDAANLETDLLAKYVARWLATA